MPLLSVIIPLYNHEQYIEGAISSVLSQSFSDFELIIINDGSNDDSESKVKKINDDRISYFFQSNKGAHHALNRGIEIAKGKYISILNSDDVYTQKRFEKCLEVLETDYSIDAVFSSIEYIDNNGEYLETVIGAEKNWQHHRVENSFKSEQNLTLDLLAGNFLVTTSNIFCRAKCFNAIGSFRNFRYAHDYDFFLNFSYRFQAVVVDEPLVKYRFHDSNTINENQAASDLECALVIADFITNHDISKLVSSHNDQLFQKLFNSINTHRSDKIILALILYSQIAGESRNVTKEIIDNRENAFWDIGLKYLTEYQDGWMARDKICRDWNELHQLYLACELEKSNMLNSKLFRLVNFLKKIRFWKNT